MWFEAKQAKTNDPPLALPPAMWRKKKKKESRLWAYSFSGSFGGTVSLPLGLGNWLTLGLATYSVIVVVPVSIPFFGTITELCNQV